MPHTICNGPFCWVRPSIRQLGPRGSVGYLSIISPANIASSNSRIWIFRCLSRSVWVKEILYLLFLTFSLMSLISILERQSTGIWSPDIMADSASLKQMLVTLKASLMGQMALCSPALNLNPLKYAINYSGKCASCRGTRDKVAALE
jgi:hypothetical protein